MGWFQYYDPGDKRWKRRRNTRLDCGETVRALFDRLGIKTRDDRKER